MKDLHIVGYMSVDYLREYHSDLSQLKFINNIPKGRVSFNLNHNIDKAIKRTTDDSNENIDLLLKFLLHQKHRLNLNSNSITFVTYRRTLISVMCSAFWDSQPLRIMASLFKNCIYLCSLETEEDIEKRKSRNKKQDTFCAWGYKFEQYMLSDSPSLHPNIEFPVVENEEFSLFYCSKLEKHRLLYGAQIDGLLATCGSATEPPQSNDVETNLNYLRNNSYIELKTNRLIQNRGQERSFKKYKLLRCWCQCYLAGLKGLLVGFRNDDGIVERLQWYDTDEIENLCKYEWDSKVACSYLDYFLTFVENVFKNEMEHCSRDKPLTFQFNINNKNITYSRNNDENGVILPDWFINNFL